MFIKSKLGLQLTIIITPTTAPTVIAAIIPPFSLTSSINNDNKIETVESCRKIKVQEINYIWILVTVNILQKWCKQIHFIQHSCLVLIKPIWLIERYQNCTLADLWKNTNVVHQLNCTNIYQILRIFF